MLRLVRVRGPDTRSRHRLIESVVIDEMTGSANRTGATWYKGHQERKVVETDAC
jgi:hypothetical protein